MPNVVDPREPFNKRLVKLNEDLSSWTPHWKDINTVLLPRRARFDNPQANRGDKRNKGIIDSEATEALKVLVSGLQSGITSPSRRWARQTLNDEDLMEFGPVKEWLRLYEDLTFKILAESNFYEVIASFYDTLGAYGTSCMVMLNDFDNVVRFQSIPIGEFRIAQDHRYRVDTMYRETKMTVWQIVSKYLRKDPKGRDIAWERASSSIKNNWDNSNYDHMVDVIHAIEPRELNDRDIESPANLDMPFRSVVYEKGSKDLTGNRDHMFLHHGGFLKCPIYAGRWWFDPPDVYARGPGMDALGDIRQLQDQQKKKSLALAKMVNPPMVAHPNLKNKRMTSLPGDVTFADTTKGQQGFIPAYQVTPRLNDFQVDMAEVKQRIRRAFHADTFLMLDNLEGVQPRNELELLERRSEKFLVLGPVMTQMNHDVFDPMFDGLALRIENAEIMPPKPPELEGEDIKPEYQSLLHTAQKAQDILGIEDTARFAGSLAEVWPEARHKFDAEQAVDEFARRRGVPPLIIRSDDDVEERVTADQQAAAQQQAVEQAGSGAAAAKALSEAQTTEESNLLNDILQGASSTPP